MLEPLKRLALEDVVGPTPQDSTPEGSEPRSGSRSGSTIRPTLYSALIEDQREQLRFLQREYEYNRKSYDQRRAALSDLELYIQRTIHPTKLSYTYKCDLAYQMLVNLKNRFAPTDEAREQELIQTWKKLQKGPKGQDVENWLQKWETTYDDGLLLRIPDVQDH